MRRHLAAAGARLRAADQRLLAVREPDHGDDGNGRQVEYDGHPLYRYAGDSGADQANGEGKGGVWFVATSSLGSGSTATPSAAAVVPGY